MHRGTLQGRINYQKALLAVYWLADDEGLLCEATNAELCAQTGLYVETMRGYLKKLEEDGVIRVVRRRRRPRRRFIVLLDHQDAEGFIDGLTDTSGPLLPTWTDGPR